MSGETIIALLVGLAIGWAACLAFTWATDRP